MACWLVKTEPGAYAFHDLEREGRTAWTGVKNALAQQHLRAMSPGDEVLVYHTGAQKQVVGRARVGRAAYADPGAPAGKLVAVDLVPLAPLARPVTLVEIRAEARCAAFDLVRQTRLSVLPVPPAIHAWILARSAAPGARRPR